MSQASPTSAVRASDPVLPPRRRPGPRRAAPAAALVAVAAALTACGGGGGGTTGQSATPKSSAPTGGTASGETIKTATVGKLGNVLVDGEGRTVYLFEKDTGGKSSCSGACAGVWPPVTTGAKPQAGAGTNASLLGTTGRSDGTTEVTYAGHPLYYYAPDGTTGGSAKGEGLNQFGAAWYVLSPSGNKVQMGGY